MTFLSAQHEKPQRSGFICILTKAQVITISGGEKMSSIITSLSASADDLRELNNIAKARLLVQRVRHVLRVYSDKLNGKRLVNDESVG